MKMRFLVPAGLIFIISSVTYAQNLYIVSSSTPAFGQALTYAWSRQMNSSPIADSFLAEEVQNQINKQMQDNIGLWLVPQGADLIVVARTGIGFTGAELSSGRPEETPDSLVIELHDAKTDKLVWRGVAENVLNKGESQEKKQIMGRTIARMFDNFPYHVPGWVYATP
jgi:hypothetical protein